MQLTMYLGTNGTGKTTLYRSGVGDHKGRRINIDEIALEIGEPKGFFPMRAGKQGLRMIAQCLSRKQSFNVESTLCGQRVFRTLKQAKQLGYEITLYYLFVDSPEIAIDRVHQRAAKGGHSIPDEVIERRYYDSLDNLKRALRICDKALIIDNSAEQAFKLAVAYREDKFVYMSNDLPDGLRHYLK